VARKGSSLTQVSATILVGIAQAWSTVRHLLDEGDGMGPDNRCTWWR